MAPARTLPRASFAILFAGVARAAELHDGGKVAVPDEILAKGEVDSAISRYRRHPVAGERILSVADSMRPVARRAGAAELPEGAGTHFDPHLAEVVANLDTVVSGLRYTGVQRWTR